MSYFRISNGKYFLNNNATVVDVKNGESIANRYKTMDSATKTLECIANSPRLHLKLINAGFDINEFKPVEYTDSVKIPNKVKCETEESLESFTDFVKDLVYQKLSHVEQEQEDILHVIENGGIDAVTLVKCAKRLKEVRNNRRILKGMYSALNNPNVGDKYTMRTSILNDILIKEN